MNSEISLGLNPGAFAFSVYRPGVMLWKEYSPAPLELVVFSTAVSTLRRFTVAPVITAPLWSRTAPWRVASETWARAVPADRPKKLIVKRVK